MRSAVAVGLALALAACGGDDTGDDTATPDANRTGGPAAEIGFTPVEPLAAGEWLVFNEWSRDPNAASFLPIAGLDGTRRDIFTVNRVWSMGATANASMILFSAWDPNQQADFGITIGDAIQNSFRYDAATQSIAQLDAGGVWQNVNDECHEPSLDGAYVYVCRRYDFTPQGVFQGWRIGRFTVGGGAFEFLRPESPGGPFELNAQDIGGNRILFEIRQRPPATGAALFTRDLPTGTEVMVRADAARPIVGPNGRVLYHDTMDRYRLKELDLANPTGAAIVVSPTEQAGDAAWSPDGNTIIYAVFDQALSCDHLEQVTRAGTAWSAPTRVRDCTATGEFLTDVAWVRIP